MCKAPVLSVCSTREKKITNRPQFLHADNNLAESSSDGGRDGDADRDGLVVLNFHAFDGLRPRGSSMVKSIDFCAGVFLFEPMVECNCPGEHVVASLCCSRSNPSII